MSRKSSNHKIIPPSLSPRFLPLSLSASRLPSSLKNMKAFNNYNPSYNSNNNSLKYLKLAPINSSADFNPPQLYSPTSEQADSRKESLKISKIPILIRRRVSRCACSSIKGQINGIAKQYNQDSTLLIPKLNNVPYQFLFGVFDGHGDYGHSVSALIKSRIKSTISSLKPSTELNDLTTFITNSIYLANQTVISSPIDSKDSGSTLNLVLISGDKLVCGNVGDSRCVIGKFVGKEWKVDVVSKDHKPSDPAESERVIKEGGLIDYDPFGGSHGQVLRVWSHNAKAGGLAMTRSIGDRRLAKFGVISEPEVFVRNLNSDDKFVVIASDGLWDVVDANETVVVVADKIRNGHARIASQTLADLAKERWMEKGDCIDDISVIVVLLNSKI